MKRLGSIGQPGDAKRARRRRVLLAAGGSFPKAVTVPARCPSSGRGPRCRAEDAQGCKPALLRGQQRCPARARLGQRSHAEPGTPRQACAEGVPSGTAARPSPRATGSPATGREEHAATQLGICATLGDAGLPPSPVTKCSSFLSPHTLVKHLVSRSRTCPPSPTHWGPNRRARTHLPGLEESDAAHTHAGKDRDGARASSST